MCSNRLVTRILTCPSATCPPGRCGRDGPFCRSCCPGRRRRARYASQKVCDRPRTTRGQPGAGPAFAPPAGALPTLLACPDLVSHQRQSRSRRASPPNERNCWKTRRLQDRGRYSPALADDGPCQTRRTGLTSGRLCSVHRSLIGVRCTRRMSTSAGPVQMVWLAKAQTGSRDTERR